MTRSKGWDLSCLWNSEQSISTVESYSELWSPGNKSLCRQRNGQGWRRGDKESGAESELRYLRAKGEINRTKRSKGPDQDAKGFWPHKPHVICELIHSHKVPKVHPTWSQRRRKTLNLKLLGKREKEHFLSAFNVQTRLFTSFLILSTTL